MAKMYGPCSRKQQMILENDADFLIIGGAAGCLSKDHEVMTPNGWIRISEWDGQDILQFDKETGKAMFIQPEEFVKLECDKLTRVVQDGVCQELSDEHTVLYIPEDGTDYGTLSFKMVAGQHADGELAMRMPTAFVNMGGTGLDISDEELKEKARYYKFTNEWYNCDRHQLLQIWYEIYMNGNDPHVYVVPTKEQADFLQYLGSSLGFNAQIFFEQGYKVVFSNERAGTVALNSAATFEEFEPEDGYKYCFVTTTGYFITRLENCIAVTGNSGKSFLLQLLPLKMIDDPNTSVVMFRRTTPQLEGEGGLWPKALGVYMDLPDYMKPKFREKDHKFTFPYYDPKTGKWDKKRDGAVIKYCHMEYESDKLNHQGLEYTLICFDEG